MHDLASSFVQFRYHHPGMVSSSLDGDGVSQDHSRIWAAGLPVIALPAERCWIRSDRPHGGQRSIAALDDLRALLR